MSSALQEQWLHCIPSSSFNIIFLLLTKCITAGNLKLRRELLTDEVVCDGPHPLLRHDDPNDDDVSKCGHHGHAQEHYGPNHLAPPRKRISVA